MQFRYDCVSAMSHRKTQVHTRVNQDAVKVRVWSCYWIKCYWFSVWGSCTLKDFLSSVLCAVLGLQTPLPEQLCACRLQNTTVIFNDVLKLCRMRGRPLSSPSSFSLFPSYLLSSIIDCSHRTNFICWLWKMNETRTGDSFFSSLLVWYPISHLQCTCAFRDQARDSQPVPNTDEILPRKLLCRKQNK